MTLARLAALAEDDETDEHLAQACPWYRHVSDGGNEDIDRHCPAPGSGAVPRLVVKLTERTAEASTVPQPTVPPGGPGLWHVKGMQLPPYIQHLYKHLVARYGKEKAYGVAKGIVAKWAQGIAPGGKKGGKPRHTHPDVQAAASRNIADWEEKRARAHAQHAKTEAREGKTKSSQVLAASAVPLAAQNMGTATAPGAGRFAIAPGAGGSYAQYGLYQHPSQTTAASPPLPPSSPLPTPQEVRALLTQVPADGDVALTATVRKFLEQAAGKLERDAPIEALASLRGAQTAIYSASKTETAEASPGVFSANIFARVPPAEQSSATSVMRQSVDRRMAYRGLEQKVGVLADRIRRRFFHGVYAGPSQLRLTEDDMSAVGRLAALAGITTGKDVSFPTETDVTGLRKLEQVPPATAFSFTAKARAEIGALSPMDQLKVASRMQDVREHVAAGNFMLASKSLLAVKFIVASAGALAAESELADWIRMVGYTGNNTNSAEQARRMEAGGKAVSRQDSRQTVIPDAGPARLTARLR